MDGRDAPAGGAVVQSVDRALRILEFVADEDGALGLTEIARRLGVHPATASRLVSTLAIHGILRRSAGRDGVELGPALARFADASIAGLELVRRAKEVLRELAEATEETVSLGVRDGRRVVYLDEVSGSPSMVSASWIGRRTPIHCTSDGKVLLAYLPSEERAALLAGALEALTPQTILDVDELVRQVEEARIRGYASAVGEVEVGLNGVASAVRDADGRVVATVSVAGPAYRVTRERIPELGLAARRAADQIARRIGFHPTGG